MNNKEVPVLLIAFSRVDYARKTFEAIKRAKPAKFYFYTNKGRAEFPEECRNNEIVRSMVNEVDWPCELKTWFRDEPVNMLDSIRLAIDWVFRNEEMAIVMEEDCVGAPAWFDFASDMLVRYKDDKRIWMIGGSNYAEDYNPKGYSYHITRFCFINGWASWRDRWQSVSWDNLNYNKLITEGVIDSYFSNQKERLFHKRRIKQSADINAINKCWDFAFWYTAVEKYSFFITPSRHLVQNVGIQGVHQGPLAKLRGGKRRVPYNSITFKEDSYGFLKHPPFICPDNNFDKMVFNRWAKALDSWYIRFLRYIYHKFTSNRDF